MEHDAHGLRRSSTDAFCSCSTFERCAFGVLHGQQVLGLAQAFSLQNHDRKARRGTIVVQYNGQGPKSDEEGWVQNPLGENPAIQFGIAGVSSSNAEGVARTNENFEVRCGDALWNRASE